MAQKDKPWTSAAEVVLTFWKFQRVVADLMSMAKPVDGFLDSSNRKSHRGKFHNSARGNSLVGFHIIVVCDSAATEQ